MSTCDGCRGPLDENGTCPRRESVRAQRIAQGLPPTIEDPAALDAIAVLFGDSLDRAS